MQIPRQYSRVYVKSRWNDGWQAAPYIEPLTADRAASPSIGMAKFKVRYGQGFWEDGSAMMSGDDIQQKGIFYIQIMVAEQANFSDEKIAWTGFADVQQFDCLGDKPVKTVDIDIVAYDLIKLLELPLEGAYVLPVGASGGTNAILIDSLPTFNKRYEYEGAISGNRSAIKYNNEDPLKSKMSYVFSDEGEVWTNADILEYLIVSYYQPIGGLEFSIEWLKEEYKSVWKALGQITNIYDFNGMTLKQAIDALIPRSRGLAWWVEPQLSGDVEIIAESLLDEALTVNDITLPKNPDSTTAEIWNYPTDQKVTVVVDNRGKADKITVRGAKMKTCFTISFADGTFEKAWTDKLETAYKNAAKDTSGYGDLSEEEQIAMNERYRSADKFRRVYTSFRIPREFEWSKNRDKLIPKINPVTGVIDENTNAGYWNAGKRILSKLPFREGVDYSEGEPNDENPAHSEPKYKPILAFVKGTDGKYYPAEKFGTEVSLLSAMVRPMEGELGVEVRFNPAYAAAKNHFSGAEPGRYDIEDEDVITPCDWQDHIITVFIETDQYSKLEYQLTETAEIKNHIIIDLPAAELWYVAPDTVYDIDENGEMLTYGGPVWIRDDYDMLNGTLAAAVAWHSKTRYKVNILTAKIDLDTYLGKMFTEVDPTGDNPAAGAVVTHMSFDFANSQTVIDTDFGELNLAAIAAGRRKTPAVKISGGADSKKLNRLAEEVEKIKEQIGMIPQRIEIPPVFNTDTKARRAKLTAAAGEGNTITANLYDNAGVEQTEGEESGITVYFRIHPVEVEGAAAARMDAAMPLLASGEEILVNKVPVVVDEAVEWQWHCTADFRRADICPLDEEE